MTIKSVKLNKGFTAVELLLVLAVIASIIYISINLINSWLRLVPAQTASKEAYSYSQAVARYITTHQNLLITLLSPDGSSSDLVATVSPQVLVNEGYINNLVSTNNNLKQTPCAVIFYQNKQLQSIVYYRDDNNSKQLDQRQLTDGLNHMGAMMGLYQNGIVTGAAKDWALDATTVNALFVAQGSVDISQGTDTALYYCSGSQIANNSYVVNVTHMLNLNNKLPNDDTIHQFSDHLHDITDSMNNNQMNTDLNMDYTNPNTNVRTRSNIIFQNNPNCEMDPNKPETMENYSVTNPNGCKNRQLGLQVDTDTTGRERLTVTGFVQGGVNAGTPSAPYVGQVSAASLQPTTKVAVGTGCSQAEIGKIAQQQTSSTLDDVNNIYVSQVICMKSPTCPAASGGFCYLPVQNVTINFKPNKPSYMCPAGMFITNVQSNVQQYPDWGRHCCSSDPVFGCHGYASAHDHFWEGYTVYKDSTLIAPFINGDLIDGNQAAANPLELPPVTSENLMLPTAISLGKLKYGYTCDAICQCPGAPTYATEWQPNITSMTCTNDPSEAAIQVKVD